MVVLLIMLFVIAAFPIVKDFTQNNKPGPKMQSYVEQIVKDYIRRNAKEIAFLLEDAKKEPSQGMPKNCHGTPGTIE